MSKIGFELRNVEVGMDIVKKTFVVVGLLAAIGCQSPEQKLRSEQREAAKEVGSAQHDLAVTKAEAARDVAKADPEDKADAKVEATKDIADAQKKVADEKVEATEEVEDAREAVEPGGEFKRE